MGQHQDEEPSHVDAGAAPPRGVVAVVAHRKKRLDGGLPALREELRRHGVDDPLWYEVPKSRKIGARIDEARAAGAELFLVWGGDGSVQAAIDALAGRDATLGIIPAGTANLLATNLGIPHDLVSAVDVALHGRDRAIDVGKLNGEHFAVMAGTGMDALLIRDADRGLKDRLGRAAYVVTGIRNAREAPVRTVVQIDGHTWFEGDAGCVLVGNVGEILGGIKAFEHARPDDGRLDVGVVTASGGLQWARTLARAAFGDPARSPLVDITQARRIDIRLARERPYEVDGGDRPPTDRLKVKVVPAAVRVRVPRGPAAG